MLPAPMNELEAALWEVHARLDEARALKKGISGADEAARDLVASYLRGTADHVDALRSFLSRLQDEAEHQKREVTRLCKLRDEAESDVRRFRAHTLNSMKDAGLERARGHQSVLSLVKAPSRIEPRDLRLVPEKFFDVVPETRRLCEARIHNAREAGEHVPGVLFVDGDVRLSVR